MGIKNVFEDNRSQSIESLQFFSFLTELYFTLLEKNDIKNNQIEEFIDTIGKNYYWQYFKNKHYITSLKDYVFWQHREIYLENMKNFVSDKCSASDFACTVYYLIRSDLKEFQCLQKDFEKQATLELDPKIFQFSKIISDFEFILENFTFELTTNLTDDDLRQIVKDVLPKVKKYFIDEI